jgi:hypothetical protein
LVSDVLAGDGKIANLFYSVVVHTCTHQGVRMSNAYSHGKNEDENRWSRRLYEFESSNRMGVRWWQAAGTPPFLQLAYVQMFRHFTEKSEIHLF